MKSSSTSPQLLARIKTSADGNPDFYVRNGKKHYRIVLEVDNAPANAYAATFELDPTYYDRLRTKSPDSDGKFRLETSTYGDYNIGVSLRTIDGREPSFRTSVKAALERVQENLANPEAVKDIASH